MADNKPKFSPALITLVITVFWLAVFAFAVYHGQNGINHDLQHVQNVTGQAAK